MKGYVLNPGTGTLHIVGTNCHLVKTILKEWIKYESEDEAVSQNQRYIKNCKNCFKNR